MPARIKATSKQKSQWLIHLVIFLIVNAVLWFITYNGKMDEAFVYPWPAWITAAWGLLVIGHYALVWYNYEDPNFDEWVAQTKNG